MANEWRNPNGKTYAEVQARISELESADTLSEETELELADLEEDLTHWQNRNGQWIWFESN